jgi:mitogen-activated protein kinase kinase 1
LAPVAQPEDRGMTITDTMTLVVGGSDGQYAVKESGVLKNYTPAASPAAGAHASSKPDPVLGKVRFEDLEMLENLGSGSQGRVRKVRNKLTNELLALKAIPFSGDAASMRTTLHQELQRTAALKHPNVVSSYEAYFRDGVLFVLLELMDRGSVADVVKRAPAGLPDEIVAYVAKQILLGMAHLHESRVIHRDIKPANLLANSRGEVKISDFGVAGDSRALHETAVGSTPYMSPERIRSQPYTNLGDIWAIGVTIAEMAIGTNPFGDIKAKAFELCQFLTSDHVQPRWDLTKREVSPMLKEFVAMTLLPAESRPDAKKLLEHPFLAMGNGVTPAAAGAFFGNPSGSM